MVRLAEARIGFAVLGAGGFLLLVTAVAVAREVPRTLAFDTAVVLPSALLGFAVLAVLAPLIAGGGYELYPDDQLVSYPIRPATTFVASLIQAPLNLAWMVQVIVLAAATSFAVNSSIALLWALPVLGVYIASVTVLGQTISWLVVGARQTRRGEAAVWLVAAVTATGSLGVLVTRHVTDLLDRAPTVPVVTAMIGSSVSHIAWVTACLLADTIASAWAGVRLVGWCQRRPARLRAVGRQAASMPRRSARVTTYREILATDRASVWRSAPLRRGALVTALLPGVLAAAAGVDWFTIVVIPGLVAAGAGLLFGVNLFALDAQGAVWLAAQPLDPRTQMRAKLQVTAEVCLASAALSTIVAALRSDRAPGPADLAAVICALVACTTAVVAVCSDLSVSRPHRADLRGARDTPAPPGAMVSYSVRLATVATVLGMTFGGLAQTGSWIPTVLLCVTIVCLGVVSVQRDLRRYAEVGRRAFVVTTVAHG
jgi:hypothetical protein